MDSDTLRDLKQFISATVAQQLTAQTQELREEIRNDTRTEVQAGIAGLRAEMNERFDIVLGAIGEQFTDHERRFTKLEARAA